MAKKRRQKREAKRYKFKLRFNQTKKLIHDNDRTFERMETRIYREGLQPQHCQTNKQTNYRHRQTSKIKTHSLTAIEKKSNPNPFHFISFKTQINYKVQCHWSLASKKIYMAGGCASHRDRNLIGVHLFLAGVVQQRQRLRVRHLLILALPRHAPVHHRANHKHARECRPQIRLRHHRRRG